MSSLFLINRSVLTLIRFGRIATELWEFFLHKWTETYLFKIGTFQISKSDLDRLAVRNGLWTPFQAFKLFETSFFTSKTCSNFRFCKGMIQRREWIRISHSAERWSQSTIYVSRNGVAHTWNIPLRLESSLKRVRNYRKVTFQSWKRSEKQNSTFSSRKLAKSDSHFRFCKGMDWNHAARKDCPSANEW